MDACSGSKADPIDSESIHSKNQSYWEKVCVLRLYMKRLFIPELEYVCPSCQANPWTFRKRIRTCPRGVTLETDQTSLEAGVGIHLLQSVVPSEERINQINDNYFCINLLFQLHSSVVKDASCSKTMECNNSVYSGVVKNTSPAKTMESNDSVYSGVVKNTSPSKTMECDDSVQNSSVHTKVRSVVPFVSETVKTGNSCGRDNFDTLKIVHNDSDTIATTNKYVYRKTLQVTSCCNSCTYCDF